MRTQTSPKHLTSIAEAAAAFDVTPKTIRRRIADGTITGYRVGPKLLRVDLGEIEAKLIRQVPAAGYAA